MTFAVITRVADPETGGNLASELEIYREVERGNEENGWLGRYERLPITELLNWNLRTPVFNVGEVLILGESGREVAYPGRKPDKWDVDYETFDDLHEAVTRADEVFEKSLEALRG